MATCETPVYICEYFHLSLTLYWWSWNKSLLCHLYPWSSFDFLGLGTITVEVKSCSSERNWLPYQSNADISAIKHMKICFGCRPQLHNPSMKALWGFWSREDARSACLCFRCGTTGGNPYIQLIWPATVVSRGLYYS